MQFRARSARSVSRLAIGVTVAVLSTLPNGRMLAQDEGFAPLALQVPAGTRTTALGGALVAVRDVEAVFSNPALAGTVNGTAVTFTRFGRGATGGTMASTANLGPFGIGIGVQLLDFRTPGSLLPVASDALTNEVGSTTGSSLAANLALSTVFKGYRWGAALKFAQERVGGLRNGVPAFDLGVAKEGGQFTVGLVVQNIGSSVEILTAEAPLPLRVTLGMAGFGRPVGPFDFGLSFALSVLRDGFVSPAGGMEWVYTPLDGYTFVFRAGARRPELRAQQPLTAGAAFTLDRFTLEYSFDDVSGGFGHRFGLRVR